MMTFNTQQCALTLEVRHRVSHAQIKTKFQLSKNQSMVASHVMSPKTINQVT